MIDSVAYFGGQILGQLGPLLLIIGLGIVAFLLLEVLCMAAAMDWPAAQHRQNRTRGILAALLCVVAIDGGLVPRPLAAQAARVKVDAAPLQPKFTRIFGSDSMAVSFPALSPDGRWIVFHGGPRSFKGLNLWVVPAIGGVPIQLTFGSHNDALPKWFPSGDRIAFVSDRPAPAGEVLAYVMTIPFDPQTGRSTGPVQQVSLEPAYEVAVSPDGRSILFETLALPGTRRLMVVPSTGGTARTVVQTAGFNNRPEWSPDGRDIYFLDRAFGAGRSVLRVSAEGGQPQSLWTTTKRLERLHSATRQVISLTSASPAGAASAQILTFEGRQVTSIPLHRNMYPFSFSADGQSVLAAVAEGASPIRIVPVGGGPSRSLTEAREYDELNSWSSDATRLSVVTRTNGHVALLDFSVDGGLGVEVAAPPEGSRRMLSPDRTHLFYVVSDSAAERKSLWVRRLSDGRSREIARDLVLPPLTVINGPGGSGFSGQEMLYFGRRGDRFELRVCAAEGAPQVLRSYPALGFSAGRSDVGVHGKRVAWTEVKGDSSALFVAEDQNGTARRVAVVSGRLAAPVWSPDGRWIAANYFAPGKNFVYSVFVVGVTPGGQPSAPPRLVNAGVPSGYTIKWMPDSRAVTVIGETGDGADVWLISLREGDPPVNLTRDDPSYIYDYSLSPDGKYIAYPAEVSRGSSIWRIDLRR